MAPKWMKMVPETLLKMYVFTAIISAFFVTELVLSHFTHSLTLLTDAYHTLFNIVLLIGFIITVKMSRENTIKNTFGWARIEVLGLLVSILALAALCFSVLVEALQTLVHSDHTDAMHHPLQVLIIGVVGIALNVICFLAIGGFAHGTRNLSVNSNDVQVNVTVPEEVPIAGNRLLTSKQSGTNGVDEAKMRKELLVDFVRNTSCSFFVTVCASAVYMTAENVAEYIDPILSIVSVVVLIATVYPFFKESGMILLQTVPSNIEVEVIKEKLIKQFPSITNVHHFHVWRLTQSKVIATVHIKFISSKAYSNISEAINNFFSNEGIELSTVQPEFENWASPSLNGSAECILRCRKGECRSRMCCKEEENVIDTNSTPGDDSAQETELELEPLASCSDHNASGHRREIDSETDT